MADDVCLHLKTSVVRTLKDGLETRRERRCLQCKRTFWTIEKIEPPNLTVMKTKKASEKFSFEKLYRSIEKAYQGLEVEKAEIDEIAYRVLERLVQETSENVVASGKIGRLVLEELDKKNTAAWVRFAGYYFTGRNDEALQKMKEGLKPLIVVGQLGIEN